MASGRNDTATPGWVEWQVPDGPQAERQFGNLTLTMRAAKHGDRLVGQWYKAGLVTGATMATDGIVERKPAGPAELVVELKGLTPGRHSLVTYHNRFQTDSGDEISVQVVGEGKASQVKPTYRVASNEQCASVYSEFTAIADKPVNVKITSRGGEVVLNGIEIDTSDPKAKATHPQPAAGDWHADADGGTLELQWQSAASAVKHRLYMAAAHSLAEAQVLLAPDTPDSSFLLASDAQPSHTIPVDPTQSLTWYCWRVDSIDTAGKITRGDTWGFRPRHLAFPDAEGYGRFAIGGRGGQVLKVTNLEDSGPGSLRAAVEATGPRTVVFDVAGRIVLKSKLIIRDPFLTIAGQTAPGKGICISNYNLGLLGNHDCILRYLRIRPGNTAGVTLDGMGLASSDNAIIDHCSISWTLDEAFSSRAAQNITLQRTLISEALNVAGHAKYKAGTQHGYAASIGGDIGSFHHNLLADCAGRNWSLAGGLDKGGVHAGRLDIRNNVVYNWSHRTTDGGAKQVNFVNNYYKPGPASQVFHVLMAEREAVPQFGPQMYYVDGNVMEGRFGAAEKLAGVIERRGEPHENWVVDKPFFESYVSTTSAKAALRDVLSDVGCNEPRLDFHDERVIVETLRGTTRFQGSVTGYPGIPDSQDDVGGWEDYGHQQRGADWDADNDGLPGWWEGIVGLNPESHQGDLSDANGDADGDGYTNLEEYLEWLATPHFDCPSNGEVEVNLPALTRGYVLDEPRYSIGEAEHGSARLVRGNQHVRFTAEPGYRGLASFTFTVTDKSGNTQDKTVNLRVLAAEKQP